MTNFLHILHYKLLSFFSINFAIKRKNAIRNLGSAIFFTSFAFGTYVFTQLTIDFLLFDTQIGLFLLHEFIAMILFVFFLSVNVGNIIVSYSTLYRSAEVSYFFTKPVNPVEIFIIKFLDNFFYSSSTLLMVLFSMLAAYTYYFDLGIWEALYLVLFQFLPFMFSAASLGVIVLMIVLKAASKIGIKPFVVILASIYISAIFFFFKLTSPADLVVSVLKYYPDIDRYFGDMLPPILQWLPNSWLGNSMFWCVQGNVESSFPMALMQIGLSVLLFGIAVLLGKLWYKETWYRLFDMRGAKVKSRDTKSFFNGSKSFFKPVTESVIYKDAALFIREPSQVFHFLILVLLIFVFALSIKGIALMGFEDNNLQSLVYLAVLSFNILLISTLSLRFVFPLISLEGKAFWKILTAPVAKADFIKLKLLPVFLLIFTISQLLAVFSIFQFTWPLAIISMFLISFISIALIFMNFGMGGYFAVYHEKNPIRIASSRGATLSFLLALFYIVFVVSVLIVPLQKYFKVYMIYRQYAVSELIFATTIIGIASVAIASFFYRLGINAIRRDF